MLYILHKVNTSIIVHHSSDISSSRLFCRGVPVNNSLRWAWNNNGINWKL